MHVIEAYTHPFRFMSDDSLELLEPDFDFVAIGIRNVSIRIARCEFAAGLASRLAGLP